MNNTVHNIFLSILFSVIAYSLSAQKYTEGEIELGIIQVESLDGSELDPTIKQAIETELGNVYKSKFYFTKDKLGFEKKGPFGDIILGIYDVNNQTVYEFIDIKGQPAFKTEKVDEAMTQVVKMTEDNGFTIKEVKNIERKPFGLDCKEYTIIVNGGAKIKMVTTTDIEMPIHTLINPSAIDLGTTVESIVINEQANLKINLGIISFTPSINDRSRITIDTTGMMNANSLKKQIEDTFSQLDEYEQLVFKEFGEYESQNINHDLIKTLAKDGLLDSTHYDIKSVISGEREKNYDIPEIMILGSRGNSKMSKLDRKELLESLENYNLASPTVKQLLTISEKEWSQIAQNLRYKAICVAAIKDHLTNKDTKENITNNLEVMGYCDFSNNPIKNNYLNDIASLTDIINEVYLFTPLDYKVAYTDSEIFMEVKYFLDKALSEYGIRLIIEQSENNITVNDGQRDYLVDLDSFKESEYDYEKEQEIIKDTVQINEYFYNQLLDIVKQISADNALNKVYNIYHFEPPFIYYIDNYDFRDIIKSCPILDFGIDQLYLWKATPQGEDIWSENIPISFPFHPDAFTTQLNLGNFSIGDGSGNVNYITTEQKLKFIAYLTKYQSQYRMSDETLQYKISNIRERLFQSTEELTSILPSSKITVSKIFDIEPKSQYNPKFSEGQNEFKHAYYSLHQIIGDDFNATNYRYDEAKHKIYFEYNGQEYIVNPGEKNMLRFIINNVKAPKSGRQFYPIQQFSVTTEEYYYLTPDQKNDLGRLIKLNF